MILRLLENGREIKRYAVTDNTPYAELIEGVSWNFQTFSVEWKSGSRPRKEYGCRAWDSGNGRVFCSRKDSRQEAFQAAVYTLYELNKKRKGGEQEII